ncbi:MAG: hypothetical protein EON93_06510 [Burkholderiales bacterium]|nr:MAG: hypothetical protein EON93_06510 [Burkholderiales bacterium]
MKIQQTVHTENAEKRDSWRNLIIVAIGTSGMIALAMGVMALLTSPDGWVMKAASQAMVTAHEGTLASYTLADSQ